MSRTAKPIEHVILDRDGVLNVERDEGGYLEHWSQWRWLPGALEGLAMLASRGVMVSVATNQAGVGRGILAREALEAIHARMTEEAAHAGGPIHQVLVCPHSADDACDCRKPAPGLLLRAMRSARAPRDATIMVGDDLRDMGAARAAGIAPVLVRTGKGRLTEAAIGDCGIPVFEDLRAFTSALLSIPPG